MPRIKALIAALMIGGVTAVTSISGCAKPTEPPKPAPPAPPTTDGPKKSSTRTAIAAGDGVIKGKIVFAGDPPAAKALDSIKDPKYKECCLAPEGKEKENVEQKWLVGKDKGVANVVIFLKAPAGSYFEPSDADKKKGGEVLLDQPHCAFIPHVLAFYPVHGDADPKKSHPTGQVFKVKNSAVCLHNTKIAGDPLKGNVHDKTLKPQEVATLELKPQSDPITISCSVHPWMSAKAWVFDHPYFAVTGEDGSFEIKGVPTDTKISVVGWHEGALYFHGGNGGTEYTLEKGKTKDLGTIEIK